MPVLSVPVLVRKTKTKYPFGAPFGSAPRNSTVLPCPSSKLTRLCIRPPDLVDSSFGLTPRVLFWRRKAALINDFEIDDFVFVDEQLGAGRVGAGRGFEDEEVFDIVHQEAGLREAFADNRNGFEFG